MRLVAIALCSCSLCVSSCASTTTNQPPKEITRSPITPMEYDQWRLRNFTNVNLRLDLPVGVRSEEVFDGKIWILSMGFHYLSPPPGVLDDATVFVHVYVERVPITFLTEKLASVQRGNLYKESTEEERKIWHWYYNLHSDTSRWDGKGQYSYYRRDIKLSEKDILHAHAEILNAGPQESRDADHAAVKRILDSITPLNVTTNK